MRILAVHAEAPCGLWSWLRPWRSRTAIWHAVAERTPAPTITICGGPIRSEALRTWEQAPFEGRCPECEHAIAVASMPSAEIGEPEKRLSVRSNGVNLVRRRRQ